jgi:hypothetical protein
MAAGNSAKETGGNDDTLDAGRLKGGGSASLAQRFSRRRSSFTFIAQRILQDADDAERVVRNCFQRANCSSTALDDEGGFGGSTLRMVIAEVVLILRERQRRAADRCAQTF